MHPLNLPEPPVDARLRRHRGQQLQSLTLELKTVTPILGGGPVARSLPEVDIIRVPTLRGHLRFWWRALYGYRYTADGESGRLRLAHDERELWGGMGQGEEDARRSQVELRVMRVKDAGKDEGKVNLGTPPAYALWPARNRGKVPDVPRWSPGLQFTLELLAPEGEPLLQARRALQAWILLGGYGSHTRRGCGTVTLVSPEQRKLWLPESATRSELRRLFGEVPLFELESAAPPCDLPLLRGAHLYRSSRSDSKREPNGAWLEALDWLREFRQGPFKPPAGAAREQLARNPGEGNRAGRSNWPEADKVRHHARPSLKGRRGERSRTAAPPRAYPEVHAPRPEYTRAPAWPRAGFGLPIVFHFQQEARKQKPDAPPEFYQPAEPEGVQLQWEDRRGDLRDRLASPLIVKALPLADGRFEPIALWLERGYPRGGHVVLTQDGPTLPGTQAPFDQLRAQGDRPIFQPLQRALSVREAFFTWLEGTRKARKA
ncbi:RAMP superfamily CRISPR-associated protein [Pyxidicoccus sp. 3LG]